MNMLCSDVTSRIIELCNDESLDFSRRGRILEEELNSCSVEEITAHLDYAGIIPEIFEHDSTEEKVFAKYCDALLARTLCLLGLKSQVIVERADSADVLAQGINYSLVGDAKAFRLSRTAKNQKDFKVEALNVWRKGANYACLVAPLFQYPNTSSQIYLQATNFNVTLLSYDHLSFLLKNKGNGNRIPDDLHILWEVGRTIEKSKSAENYWRAVESAVLYLTNKTQEDWTKAVTDAQRRLPEQAEAQIRYLENEKSRINELTREVLIQELIQLRKLESKIVTIKRATGF